MDLLELNFKRIPLTNYHFYNNIEHNNNINDYIRILDYLYVLNYKCYYGLNTRMGDLDIKISFKKIEIEFKTKTRFYNEIRKHLLCKSLSMFSLLKLENIEIDTKFFINMFDKKLKRYIITVYLK